MNATGMSINMSMMNASASGLYSGTAATGEDQIAWRLASKGQLFKFEEAMSETTVVAGCEDGSAKIWSNTAVRFQLYF